MPGFKDLTSQKFGRLTVIRRASNTKSGGARWHCVCDCRNETIISSSALNSGSTVSCGCWSREQSSVRQLKDLMGKKFGRLTVTGRAPNSKSGDRRWYCECECGNKTIVFTTSLRSGDTSSCGCWKGRLVAQRNTKHGHGRRGKASPEYEAHRHLKDRVLTPNCPEFEDYGGRGIRICQRWLDGEGGKSGFECFLADVGLRPGPGYSIGRIDNDGNYEPGNVRWEKQRPQMNNTRVNRRITAFGRTENLATWARMLGIHRSTLGSRLKKTPPEQALAHLKLKPCVMWEMVFVPASETYSQSATWEWKLLGFDGGEG
jgi:hypothetical protein